MRWQHGILGTALATLIIITSDVQARNSCEYSKPYREDEKVCQGVGDVYDVMKCLAGRLSDARKKLKTAESGLINLMRPKADDSTEVREKAKKRVKMFKEANELWRKNLEKTCSEFITEFWYPGSFYKTEPLRCKYFATKEREHLLRLMFNKQFRFLECGYD